MITLKLKYTSSDEFQNLLKEMRREQSCIIRSSFNRFQEGLKQKDVKESLKNLDNITLLDSWWIQSAVTEAETIYSSKKDSSIIFGGKFNLKRYLKKLISNDEWKSKRLMPLNSIGASNCKGNRKFRLDVLNNCLIFQDNYGKIKHTLTFQKQLRDRLEQLLFIEEQTKNKLQPLSVKITEDFIYLTFLPKKKEVVKMLSNRVLAIDTNPNSIGWSVCDIVKELPVVVDSGVIELKELNKQSTNKKHFETFEVSKFLVDKAVHYSCSTFAVEDLTISPKEHKKGKKFNKLVNNDWLRNDLFSNLKKRCFINNLKFIEVNPAFTSIIGGVLHSKYPDPIAPTLEIARRAYFKYRKGYFYPKIPNVNILNELWKQTLEKSFLSWREVADWLKNTKYRYRVSLDSFESKVFRLKSSKSTVFCRYLYV